MDIQEIIHLLEKVLRIFDGEYKDPLFSTREIISHALTLLKQQPKALNSCPYPPCKEEGKLQQNAGIYYVYCINCGRHIDSFKKDADAITAWNNTNKPEQPTVGEWTKKFNGLIEEIKSMFTVSQAMAKNSFDSTLQIPVEGETDNPDPLPDHEYSQQPEPTSLGNTIRRIANNSKCNETDRNIIHQAADRLDAWWKYINDLKEEIDLLKQQPTAGEFTKRLRKFIKMYENEVPRRAEITFLESEGKAKKE